MKNDRERGMRKTEEGREERRLPDEKKNTHTHTQDVREKKEQRLDFRGLQDAQEDERNEGGEKIAKTQAEINKAGAAEKTPVLCSTTAGLLRKVCCTA